VEGKAVNVKSQRGFSLLEVMFATAICSIMCVGTLVVMVQIDNNNRFMFNRTVAYRATHQAMEILLAEDLDSMLLQDGNNFVVTETTSGPCTGSITITDALWGPGGAADKAYLVRLEVPRYGVVITALRART
jgi:prepilin-type N-terminal cleavage/methylation domain-containing protein